MENRYNRRFVLQSAFFVSDFKNEFCSRCELPGQACLCYLIPEIASAATFWLLTHDNEYGKATNTGKLIQAIWSQTRIVNWCRTTPDQELLHSLSVRPQEFALVFPEQYSIATQQANVPGKKDICPSGRSTSFIIIDATWQQARKIYRQSPYLHSLPLISLLPQAPSVYSLRRNRDEQHLCTAEVAAQVLRKSGEPLQADLLDALLQHFCNQYDWSRKSQKQIADSSAMQLLKQFSGKHQVIKE